jgi:PLD-like domain
MSKANHKTAQAEIYPMRIQARSGSPVERRWFGNSRLPQGTYPMPKAIAPGVSPAPLEDLIFHGGKTVQQMGFRNIYLGSHVDWVASDVQFIDAASKLALQDARLNNVMAQYFPGGRPSCDVIPSLMLDDPKPDTLSEEDIQNKIKELFDSGALGQSQLDSTVFNLILPAGTILTLDESTSTDGLGGFHGSVHVDETTLYYSANVFSQRLTDGRENGIAAFDASWKNVVATLYHEMNEFRTDADVHDAIRDSNNDFLGWMSRQGHECGDQPIFAAGRSLSRVFQEVAATSGGARIPVQFMYSNAAHGAEGPISTPDALAQPGAQAPGAQATATAGTVFPFSSTVDRVITRHLDELRKPGVVSIRPGYQSAGGWITRKAAIVVTVEHKSDDIRPEDRLPETLEGIAVDVREASPLQRLRARSPLIYKQAAASAPHELLSPTFAYTRDATGQLLAPIEAEVAAARTPKKPQLQYTAPPGFPLQPIDGRFTLTCHVSPDAGWPVLKDFIRGIQHRFTVGMYDFTAAHILQTLTASLGHNADLSLVLDHPSRDRTADQSDEETQAALDRSLGNRLQFAWALEDRDPMVSAWIFPSAYHIKVAVRDGRDFWLSSGNWNRSNQPDIDPFNDPQGASAVLKESDRDWHVIVQNDELSALFEAYLNNDLQVAEQNQALAAQAALDAGALAALAQPDVAAVSRIPAQFFRPETFTANMRVQPVLTPDNYGPVILELINSASKTLYMQIPYITPKDDPEGATLAGLIGAIARQIQAGRDVRIILSSFAKMASLEQLQSMGIDSSLIRIQNNLHNKGIIVDSRIVAIGSHNWSAPGVSTNRDATLVIFNEDAAQYWEKVFIHDWVHMATQHTGD